tara:strand:+ start:2861 stop:3208 length:348 start_codon:yes stop_codon:yes gene_type:complete
MIKVIKEQRDEEKNKLYLTIRPQPHSEGVIKLTLSAVEGHLDKLGVQRGLRLSGETITNKSGHDFEFIYKLREEPKVEEKIKEKVDNSSEPVIIKKKKVVEYKKKTTTRRKKTGG